MDEEGCWSIYAGIVCKPAICTGSCLSGPDRVADIGCNGHKRHMAQDKAVRWVPVAGLPELALASLDFAYESAQNRLTVRAYFRDVSDMGFPQFEPPAEGVIVAFENVEAFKAYEEFTDPLFAEQLEVPMLAENVPYGGSWGFIRILGSSWLARLADRNGSWDADSASHWVVKTGDKVLHVANISSTVPIFQGWIPPN